MAEPLLPSLVGLDAYQTMLADPVTFVKVFDRTPYDFQAAALREVLERGADGTFTKPLACVSWPRQNGKSTLSAWAALWRFFLDPTCDEIISVALDRASASIILGDARRIILGSDLLLSCVDADYGLTRAEIRLRGGRRWMVKSADAVFSRGLRPSMVCYDELGWTQDAGALFDVLSAAQAAQANPLTLVTSTVGPVQAGPLWGLFEAADRGDPTTRLLYSQENMSPRISPDYLERQQSLMPAHVFAREHQNRWGSGSDAYCTEQDWRRCTDGPDPRRDSDSGPSYLFVDLGWAHDETSIAVARPGEDKITSIINLETFRGTPGQPVVLAAVRGRIEVLAARLGVEHVVIESPQGLSLSQDLNLPKQVCVELLYPTAISNRERWGSLYTALRAGTVRLPKDSMLRRQLLTLTIHSGPTGWRVDDVPSVHNDRAVSVAGALYAATEGAKPRWRSIPFLAMTPNGIVDSSMGVIGEPTDSEYRSLSEERKVRIRQLVIAGKPPEIVRVQFSITRHTLERVLNDIGWHRSAN